MDGQSTFCVIEDDEANLDLMTMMLEHAGHRVFPVQDSNLALDVIRQHKPDCVITDLMMAGLDGFELCKLIRQQPALEATRLIVVTAKSYDFDKRRSLQLGADGFIRKPFDPMTFVDQVQHIVADKLVLAFWGVRGTLPVPGQKSLRYGGNTNCVSLEFPRGDLFIFDAGTGITELSGALLGRGPGRIAAKIFISHPHWDHINALPFFAPLYMQGNEFEICGASHGGITTRELISAQMDGVYFPITLKEFAARVYFRDLDEGDHDFDGITVRTKLLDHPGQCLGYRIEYQGRAVCYITDNELFLESHANHNAHYVAQLTAFIEGAEVLITDCTYTDAEYTSKVGWGHSCLSEAVDLAHAAQIGTLFLYHHDPSQSDSDIDAKLEFAQRRLAGLGSSTQVTAPAEGQTVKI